MFSAGGWATAMITPPFGALYVGLIVWCSCGLWNRQDTNWALHVRAIYCVVIRIVRSVLPISASSTRSRSLVLSRRPMLGADGGGYHGRVCDHGSFSWTPTPIYRGFPVLKSSPSKTRPTSTSLSWPRGRFSIV